MNDSIFKHFVVQFCYVALISAPESIKSIFFFSPGGVAEAPRGAVREGTSDRSRQGEFEGWIL